MLPKSLLATTVYMLRENLLNKNNNNNINNHENKNYNKK